MATRASDRAYGVLREQILDWQLEPGTVLGEVEQAARLGMSRTPVREALARLAADDLVTALPGRGLVVADVSTDNIRDLFELREALEAAAVRLAARRGDPVVFAALADEFGSAPAIVERDDPGRREYYELVERFDLAVDAAIDNPYLVAALASSRTHLARVRRLARDNPARLTAAATEHLTIARAIADGDADLAAHATHVHLHNSLRNILESTDSGRLAPPRDRTA